MLHPVLPPRPSDHLFQLYRSVAPVFSLYEYRIVPDIHCDASLTIHRFRHPEQRLASLSMRPAKREEDEVPSRGRFLREGPEGDFGRVGSAGGFCWEPDRSGRGGPTVGEVFGFCGWEGFVDRLDESVGSGRAKAHGGVHELESLLEGIMDTADLEDRSREAALPPGEPGR